MRFVWGRRARMVAGLCGVLLAVPSVGLTQALNEPAAPKPKTIQQPNLNKPGTTPPPTRIVNGKAVPTNLTAPTTPPNALVWDSDTKDYTAEPNATNQIVTFYFTNTHSGPVDIKLVRPSCGCTAMQLPPMPWRIQPGEANKIVASLDLRGKRGTLTKSIAVSSTSGYKTLVFKATVPAPLGTKTTTGEQLDPDRLKNMKMAAVDRQVVFKNENCAECHAKPTVGKMGEELYVAACAICHDTPHRATMVPDLQALKFPTSAPYWKYWIMNGRPGSLMPAFAKSHGGPLTQPQIESLTKYLTETITNKGRKSAVVSPTPARTLPSRTTPRRVPARTLPQRPVPVDNPPTP